VPRKDLKAYIARALAFMAADAAAAEAAEGQSVGSAGTQVVATG
jgi:hypothetical protein